MIPISLGQTVSWRNWGGACGIVVAIRRQGSEIDKATETNDAVRIQVDNAFIILFAETVFATECSI